MAQHAGHAQPHRPWLLRHQPRRSLGHRANRATGTQEPTRGLAFGLSFCLLFATFLVAACAYILCARGTFHHWPQTTQFGCLQPQYGYSNQSTRLIRPRRRPLPQSAAARAVWHTRPQLLRQRDDCLGAIGHPSAQGVRVSVVAQCGGVHLASPRLLAEGNIAQANNMANRCQAFTTQHHPKGLLCRFPAHWHWQPLSPW